MKKIVRGGLIALGLLFLASVAGYSLLFPEPDEAKLTALRESFAEEIREVARAAEAREKNFGASTAGIAAKRAMPPADEPPVDFFPEQAAIAAELDRAPNVYTAVAMLSRNLNPTPCGTYFRAAPGEPWIDQPAENGLSVRQLIERSAPRIIVVHTWEHNVADTDRHWQEYDPQYKAKFTGEPTEEGLKKFHDLLDRTERLLLNPRWSTETPPHFRDRFLSFNMLPPLAIRRAILEGDEPRAARLLTRHLDALSLMQPCVPGEVDHFPLNAIQASVAAYVEDCPNPREGLAGVQARLPAFRRTPADVRRIAVMHEQRFANEVLNKSLSYSHAGFWILDETLFFVRDAIARGPARSVAAQLIEALERDDMDAYYAVKRRGAVLSDWFDLPFDELFYTGNRMLQGHEAWGELNPHWKEERDEWLNFYLTLTERLVAAKRFEIEHGRPPASGSEIESMLPEESRRDAAEWMPIQLSPFRAPVVLPAVGSEETDPLLKAISLYMQEHEWMPEDAQSLKQYLPANFDTSAADDLFAEYPARTLVVRLRREPFDYKVMAEIRTDRENRFDTPPTAAERARLLEKPRDGKEPFFAHGWALARPLENAMVRQWLQRPEKSGVRDAGQ